MHYDRVVSFIDRKQYLISPLHELIMNHSRNKIECNEAIVCGSRQLMVDTDKGAEAKSNEYLKASPTSHAFQPRNTQVINRIVALHVYCLATHENY